jgi:uncharacterized protein (TIGR00645 family)
MPDQPQADQRQEKGGGVTLLPRTQRSAPFFTAVMRCRAGAVANAGIWYGPGSAERHEECRTASGTRNHQAENAMTEQSAPYRPNPALKRVETGFESLLFNSRWLMAPFYFGLVVSLAVLMLKFFMVLWEFVIHAPGSKESDIILGVLGLIDISLTGNLILIVVFSGYENFVSKIDPGGHPDWPDWMTKVNFGGLKQKLLASIVAISAIQVLKAFMNIDTVFDSNKLAWLVGVHLVFVFSAFMLAISDRWSGGDHGGE